MAPPPVGLAPHHNHGLLNGVIARLNHIACTEQLEGFSLTQMFSEVFKKRTTDEIEEYFIVGTPLTTPRIESVQTGWPKPWYFARVLIFLGFAYLGLLTALNQFGNPNLIPGLILLGSFATPASVVVLFFELNTPRNVSLHRLTKLFVSGAVVSLSAALLGYQVANLDWLGASSAGIVEEVAKLATVIFIMRQAKYKYILNGLLFGATVGAGFAAFESAGYAFQVLLKNGSHDMVANIQVRALLTPGSHVSWTALAAGALWRVKGASPFHFKMLADQRFWKAFLIPVALHMLWNTNYLVLPKLGQVSLPNPFFVKEIFIAVITWYVIFGLVQQGLHQVRAEQKLRLTEAMNQLQLASEQLAVRATASIQ